MGIAVCRDIWKKQRISTREGLGKRVVRQAASGGGAAYVHGYPYLWRSTNAKKGLVVPKLSSQFLERSLKSTWGVGYLALGGRSRAGCLDRCVICAVKS